MYFHSWEDFAAAVEKAQKETEKITYRFTTTYDQAHGELVLKFTDDIICYKYRTDKAEDLKKLSELNRTIMAAVAK